MTQLDEAARAQELLLEARSVVDHALEHYLPPSDQSPASIHASMRYSVLAPGKRLRPALLLAVGQILGARREVLLPAACALEMIHAFSLIHDDLPAMDDDDLRRGLPTNHKKFGEATAILAGDALACLAFEIVARETPEPDLVPDLIVELGRAVGTLGMIGGQVLDLEGETQETSLERVREIHLRKTAALIEGACVMGAICARVSPEKRAAAARFGRTVGLAFQVTDDLLDATSTPEMLGKGTGKDAGLGKQTWPAAVGVEATRVAAQELIEEAVSEIRHLDGDGRLAALGRYVARREN